MQPIISVHGLVKKYGTTLALDNVDLEVRQGEILGVLGPNGAGKTTLIEIMEGVRNPDAGKVHRLSLKDKADGSYFESVGIQFQTTALFENLKVGEIIKTFSSFYRKIADIKELIEIFQFDPLLNILYQNLSGGQKQRLAVLLSLVNDPEILFLDEPTVGLDPVARKALWGELEKRGSRGKTIILTTHYIEESEKLCNRIAIINKGKMAALDSPDGLKAQMQTGHLIRLIAAKDQNFDVNRFKGAGFSDVKEINESDRSIFEIANVPLSQLQNVISFIVANRMDILSLNVKSASLEDFYFGLIGESNAKAIL